MTYFIFGKGDTIVLPKLSGWLSMFGSDQIAYTKPTYDWCYCPVGFGIPIGDHIPLFEEVIRSEVDTTTRIAAMKATYDYILINRDGRVDRMYFFGPKKEEDSLKVTACPINRDSNSWWMTKLDGQEQISNNLLGFLSSDPTEEQIDSYFYKYHSGLELERLSIVDIVAEIEHRFPCSRLLKTDANRVTAEALARLAARYIKNSDLSKSVKKNLLDYLIDTLVDGDGGPLTNKEADAFCRTFIKQLNTVLADLKPDEEVLHVVT